MLHVRQARPWDCKWANMSYAAVRTSYVHPLSLLRWASTHYLATSSTTPSSKNSSRAGNISGVDMGAAMMWLADGGYAN
jgi:hypothetical protein